ncbi:CLUMA_CG008652, isoform A [Clunio marinus]|uniref:CLUMA_CG008652, isoform A n=1 Tax=Clunio marinus TaxID=568069 RepID=A0A1J1I515_9DIPT|nr:CLUMA_CG008652, isoform A [Clunio marinus]
MGGSIGWKELYICLGSLPRDEDVANITGINGEHLGSRTHSDVEAIRLTDDWLTEVPSGIDNYFPNIEFLYIRETQLKTVNSNQLQQFPNLEYLWLHKNQIETIEVNAFSRTPSLRVIALHSNKIKSIPYNAFRPLHLEVLQMRNNICINDSADTEQNVNRLIVVADLLCSPLGDMIDEDLRVRIYELSNNQAAFEYNLRDLRDQVATMEERMHELENILKLVKTHVNK